LVFFSGKTALLVGYFFCFEAIAYYGNSLTINGFTDAYPQLALLGEMTSLPGTQSKPPKSSRVDENGLMHCCSYAAQTAWLQHASIKG
jgi:hypothetical protein